MNRKKNLFLLLLCFSFALLSGQTISEQEATDFARSWLIVNAPSFTIKKVESVQPDVELPLFFFHLSPEGFLIIAGNRSLEPVLGYSLKNNIDTANLPLPLKYYIENYKTKLLSPDIAGKYIHPGWKLSPKTKSGSKGMSPLITTMWDQNFPYNSMCPNNSPAGCVAIAMAQLMNYYKYPSHGLKENSYTSGITLLSASFKDTWYNWPAMTNVATSVNTDISRLIYHCGVSVNMNYTRTSSSASTSAIVNSMVNYFGYDRASKEVLFIDKDKSWRKSLTQELNKSHPVLYGGSADVDGNTSHLFIIDGFDTDTLFHINWGWGGSGDGFYNLAEIQWQYRQRAFMNIFPPELRAEFTIDTLDGYPPFTVKFKDYSLNRSAAITSWKWDFDNDHITDSEDQNPTFIYNSIGIYPVKLIISNGVSSDTLEIKDAITIASNVNPKYVSMSGNDLSGIGTVTKPFRTIQRAIDLSFLEDTIIVENGKYLENISFKGKNITVCSKFPFSKNHFDILNTIIDGNHSGTVVSFERGETRKAQLVGFTIQNGKGSYVDVDWQYGDDKQSIGGGIKCRYKSSPALRNLIIRNNEASFAGGAIYAEISDPYISNCIIYDNRGFETIFLHTTNIKIDSSFILHNSGGGISTSSSSTVINRCLIAGNSGEIGAGLHYDYGSRGIITNSVVAGNHSSRGWGGIYMHVSTVSAANSVIYNNSPNEIVFSPSVTCGPNNLKMIHSYIRGGQSGVTINNNGILSWLENNKDFYPAFIDTISYNYRVKENCSSINDGTNFFVLDNDTILYIPSSQYIGDHPDVGIYESQTAETTIEKLMKYVLDPLPEQAGTISGPTEVCQYQKQVTFTVPEIKNANYYVWTLPDGSIKDSPSNSLSADFLSPNKSANIKVKGHNYYGDGAESSLQITIIPHLTVTQSIMGQTSICPGQKGVVFSLPEVEGATSYTWNLPAGVTGSSSTNSITCNFNSDAVAGPVTVKAVNSCNESSESNLQINIKSTEVPQIIKKWNDVLICTNLNNAFTAYQWYNGDQFIPGATRQFFVTGKKPGSYSVISIDKLNCRAQSNVISLNSSNQSFYPNPAKESLSVSFYSENKGAASISIFNSSGIIISQQHTFKTEEYFKYTVPVTDLMDGIYFIEIKINDIRECYDKVIVSK
jgi:PKD repeat protein